MTSEQNLGHVLLWRAPFRDESTPQVIQKAVASDCESNAVVSCESLQAGRGSLKTTGQLSGPTLHKACFLGKSQRGKMRYYWAFDFHDSLGICDQRRMELEEGGRQGGRLGERDYLFHRQSHSWPAWPVWLGTRQKVCNAFWQRGRKTQRQAHLITELLLKAASWLCLLL